jgi:hypothetical protein
MALADALHGLFRLPGATYACVVERDGGRVLAEVGRGEGSAGDGEGVVPYSVAGWGTAVAAMFDTTSGDELDDVMITGRRSYHLVRPLAAGAAVLVYLRLDRARSNLAAARRELAAVRWGAGAGTAGRASTPAPPGGPGPPRGGAEVRGARGGAEARAARAVGGSRGARAPAESLTGRSAVPSPPPRAPAVARVPAALPPTGTPGGGLPRAGRAAPPVRAGSGSAPDGPGPQIPLPRRAPAQRPPDVPRRRAATRASAASAEGPGVPEGFTMPAVLGQAWARDPGTLRRLIAGLRRLS